MKNLVFYIYVYQQTPCLFEQQCFGTKFVWKTKIMKGRWVNFPETQMEAFIYCKAVREQICSCLLLPTIRHDMMCVVNSEQVKNWWKSGRLSRRQKHPLSHGDSRDVGDYHKSEMLWMYKSDLNRISEDL